MTTARPVRPTDLVALVSFDGRVYANEAHTWDRLGHQPEGARLLENAFEQWLSFATGRHTWISIQGQTIRGLVSARLRGSRLAWEIDCLIMANDDQDGVLAALLEQLTAAAVRAGVLRVFLRVQEDSALLAAARTLGFVPFVSEVLLRLDGECGGASLDEGVQIRPRTATDGFALFRLYNAVTPSGVRRLEAATYAEWIAGQEKRSRGRGRLDAVAEREGVLIGWLRAVPDGKIGRLDLLVDVEATAAAPGLLAHAVRSLGTRRPLFCLTPAYSGGLLALLEEQGLGQAGGYTGLVKRLVIPVPQTAPVRGAAHNPLAVG